jgi:hypothetical protein
MAKKPVKVDSSATVERTIHIPGWGYNFVIERAAKQRRDVKAELSLIMEQALREMMSAEEKSPGNQMLRPRQRLHLAA